MEPSPTQTERITRTPGVCGGKPCIAGHRIRVLDIVWWHERQGWSADEIVDQFPGLTLSDVYAALAYYFDHQDEIEADFQREQEVAARFRGQHPSLVKPLLEPFHGYFTTTR